VSSESGTVAQASNGRFPLSNERHAGAWTARLAKTVAMSRRHVLAALLAVAAAASPSHARADDGDDEAYRQVTARGKPRYLRAGLEEGFLIGAGAVWYWLDRERQVADWDFPSIKERLTFEAWRFDTNPFPINFAWHAIDGGQYHVVGRSNDLSMLASIGYGFATSLVWEYGLEFREKFSINDMIVTTGAGTAVGEFFHWLGRYLESAPEPRRWHAGARWLLTTTRAAHVALDRRDTLREGTSPDALGLSDDIWHRFRLSSGFAYGAARGDLIEGDASLALGEVRAAGELAVMPGYLRSRHLRRWFADGNFTTLSGRVSGGGEGIGVELHADAILAGWHGQDLDADGAGHATTMGLDLAYRYRRELLGAWVDRIAQMHLPGVAVDHHQRFGRGGVRVKVRANPDFAGVHPGSYHGWEALHPDAAEPTILSKHGYYYGWGATARIEVEATLPRVEVGGALTASRYRSQGGLDRAQEVVDTDVASGDTVLVADGWLRVMPLGGRLFVEGRVSHEDRDGYVGEVDSARSLTRWALAIGAAL